MFPQFLQQWSDHYRWLPGFLTRACLGYFIIFIVNLVNRHALLSLYKTTACALCDSLLLRWSMQLSPVAEIRTESSTLLELSFYEALENILAGQVPNVSCGRSSGWVRTQDLSCGKSVCWEHWYWCAALSLQQWDIVVVSWVSPKWMELCRVMPFLLLFGWFFLMFSWFHFLNANKNACVGNAGVN